MINLFVCILKFSELFLNTFKEGCAIFVTDRFLYGTFLTQTSWVKVFRIKPEFRILRLKKTELGRL